MDKGVTKRTIWVIYTHGRARNVVDDSVLSAANEFQIQMKCDEEQVVHSSSPEGLWDRVADKAVNFAECHDPSLHDVASALMVILHCNNAWADKFFERRLSRIPVVLTGGERLARQEDWVGAADGYPLCRFVQRATLRDRLPAFLRRWAEEDFSIDNIPWDALTGQSGLARLIDVLTPLDILMQGALTIWKARENPERPFSWDEAETPEFAVDVDGSEFKHALELLDQRPDRWYFEALAPAMELFQAGEQPRDLLERYVRGARSTVYSDLATTLFEGVDPSAPQDFEAQCETWGFGPLLRVAHAAAQCGQCYGEQALALGEDRSAERPGAACAEEDLNLLRDRDLIPEAHRTYTRLAGLLC